MRFNEDVILMGKKFANKLWNIARYILMKTGDNFEAKRTNHEIIKKMESTVSLVSENINSYKFGEAAHELYDFIWHDLADKYIEETKDKEDIETKQTLAYVLINSLKLLHPFMPFVTEEIWSKLPTKDPEKSQSDLGASKKLLLVEEWPA